MNIGTREEIGSQWAQRFLGAFFSKLEWFPRGIRYVLALCLKLLTDRALASNPPHDFAKDSGCVRRRALTKGRNCQEKASAEIRGEFFRTDFLVNFCGAFFWWIFFEPFFLRKKQEDKIHPQNPQQNSNRNLGASRPKSTPQESGPEEWISEVSGPKSTKNSFALWQGDLTCKLPNASTKELHCLFCLLSMFC